jgi:hypothetical protein
MEASEERRRKKAAMEEQRKPGGVESGLRQRPSPATNISAGRGLVVNPSIDLTFPLETVSQWGRL